MIDVHTHILPNIDDGARSIENTISMLQEAKQAGFTDILFTPHYMENTYENDINEITKRVEVVEEATKRYGININLHFGNEVYLTPDIHKKIINGQVQTLNKSQYVLVELPMHTKILYAEFEFERLIEKGFIPIMAHPERYSYVQDNIKYLEPFYKRGVLLQCNYASLIGHYGAEAKKTIKKLLKMDVVTFMASDVHRPQSIYTNMDKILKKLQKYTTEEQFERITEINAKKYLLNKFC